MCGFGYGSSVKSYACIRILNTMDGINGKGFADCGFQTTVKRVRYCRKMFDSGKMTNAQLASKFNIKILPMWRITKRLSFVWVTD